MERALAREKGSLPGTASVLSLRDLAKFLYLFGPSFSLVKWSCGPDDVSLIFQSWHSVNQARTWTVSLGLCRWDGWTPHLYLFILSLCWLPIPLCFGGSQGSSALEDLSRVDASVWGLPLFMGRFHWELIWGALERSSLDSSASPKKYLHTGLPRVWNAGLNFPFKVLKALSSIANIIKPWGSYYNLIWMSLSHQVPKSDFSRAFISIMPAKSAQ